MWNELSSKVFPLHYDMGFFKKRVNRTLKLWKRIGSSSYVAKRPQTMVTRSPHTARLLVCLPLTIKKWAQPCNQALDQFIPSHNRNKYFDISGYSPHASHKFQVSYLNFLFCSRYVTKWQTFIVKTSLIFLEREIWCLVLTISKTNPNKFPALVSHVDCIVSLRKNGQTIVTPHKNSQRQSSTTKEGTQMSLSLQHSINANQTMTTERVTPLI